MREVSRIPLDREAIFLYGPPGSGKTTLGRKLAENLNLPFYDLDERIVALVGRSIAEIFAGEGEAGFRQRERAALETALAEPPGVIALGGGALLDGDNRRRVEAAGAVLCLAAPLDDLAARLQTASSARPLLAGGLAERLEELLSRRAAHYASFPLQLDASSLSSPEQVAWEAQIRLGRFYVRGMGQGYPVRILEGGLDRLGERLAAMGYRGASAAVCDENVGRIYAGRVVDSLSRAGFSPFPVQIPAGEQYKTIETVTRLWEGFLEAGLERGSPVVAVGGGVVGDLAGFAAATYLRGVPWAAVPTSLLAMADASLGGKTGADLPEGKNLIGAFHPPCLVLADPRTLETLPEAELRSGLAEVVKAGLIGDPNLFARCAEGWPAVQRDWGEIVRRSMAVKIRVIEADPYEKGLRAALNLGHTFGHALEKASAYRLRHGEAVSIGIVLASRLAEDLGLTEAGLGDTVEAVLAGLGLPVRLPASLDRSSIEAALRLDKKREQGKIRFVLPMRIGEVQIGVETGRWRYLLNSN